MSKKINLKKSAFIGALSVSSLLVVAGSTFLVNHHDQPAVLQKIRLARDFSQNVEGGNLTNPTTYFVLNALPNVLTGQTAYENILNNLAAIQDSGNNPNRAKNELIEIIKNLQLFSLLQILLTSQTAPPDVIQDLIDRLEASGSKVSSEDDITGGQENIQRLIAQMNGFTTQISSNISITGIGNTSPQASQTEQAPGAQVVDLLQPPASAIRQVNLASEYNTFVKIATINPNAASNNTNQDIQFQFNYQSPEQNAQVKIGHLIIKNANNELSTVPFNTFQRNNLIFGRWEGESSVAPNGLNDPEFIPNLDNFILARSANSSGFDLFVRAKNREAISNIRIESGQNNISQFGLLDSQIDANSIVGQTGQISNIAFYGTKTFTRSGPGATQAGIGPTALNVFLGADETFDLPIYTKPSDELSYDDTTLRRLQGDGGDVNLTLGYRPIPGTPDTSAQVTATPNQIRLPIRGTVTDPDAELALAEINILNGTPQNQTFATFTVNFNNSVITFGRGRISNNTSDVIYNREINLAQNQYADLVFFRTPGNNLAINNLNPITINALEEQDVNRQALDSLATVYSQWASNLASDNIFANNPLLLRLISAEGLQNNYRNINLRDSLTFNTSGNELYRQLTDDYQRQQDILVQLGLQQDSNNSSNIFIPEQAGQIDQSLAIISNVFYTRVPTNFLEGPNGITQRVININQNASLDQNAKDAAISLVLGDLVRLALDTLADEVENAFKDFYANQLITFLEANNLTLNQSINPNVITARQVEVLANGVNTSLSNNRQNINLYTINDNLNTSLIATAPSGSAIAKNYLDLIFKSGFGRFLYIQNNSSNLATYDSFAQSSDLQASLTTPPTTVGDRNETYLRNLLAFYDGLFSYSGNNFDALVADRLRSGRTFNLSATKGTDNNQTSFEAWFEDLNQALEKTVVAAPNENDLNYQTIELFTKRLSQQRLKNLVTGANIHNALTLRETVENSPQNANPVSEQARLALSSNLAQALYQLQVIANYSLVSGNNNPVSFVNDFTDENLQVPLVESIINEFDLRRVLNFSSLDLQSTAALAASQVPLAFTISLFVIGALLALASFGAVLGGKKTLAKSNLKILKYVLGGAVAVGLVLIGVAIASLFVLI